MYGGFRQYGLDYIPTGMFDHNFQMNAADSECGDGGGVINQYGLPSNLLYKT